MPTYSYPGFSREKCHCTLCSICLLSHTCSGLIRMLTRTFTCYLCALNKCFAVVAHVVDGHMHSKLNFWIAKWSQYLSLACQLSGKMSVILRILLNVIS